MNRRLRQRHLGYIVAESDPLDDWRSFGPDGIGIHLDEALPGRIGSVWTNASAASCAAWPRRGHHRAGMELDDHATFEDHRGPSPAATASRWSRGPPRRRPRCAASNGSSASRAPTG